MAMSNGVGVGSIVIGCTLLVLTFVSVVCGGVAMGKMTSPAGVSIGLWGFYFGIPAAFSIMAGYKKLSSLMAVALGTHILGIILGIVGVWLGAVFWAVLSSTCVPYSGSIFYSTDHCVCAYHNKAFIYGASCSDLETVRNATGAVTIMFAFFIIVSFVGSVYGCVGTCCAPRDPVMIVTTAAGQPAGTVVMTTGTHVIYPAAQGQPSVQAYPATYNQQAPPPYGPPQGQMVIDTKPNGSNW